MSLDPKHFTDLAIARLTGQATEKQAAEYQSLMRSSAQFRDVVAQMETWLSPLNEDTQDITPPPGVLESIMETLDADASRDAPANDRVSRGWKRLAIAASLIAIAAVGSHFIRPNPVPVTDNTPALMALLSDADAPALVAVIYNPQTGKVVARMSNVTVPSEKDLELWLIREGASGPVSLGLVSGASEAGKIEFELPQSLEQGTDLLAVSLEPAGGSGTAAGPQGPVLYTGKVAALF